MKPNRTTVEVRLDLSGLADQLDDLADGLSNLAHELRNPKDPAAGRPIPRLWLYDISIDATQSAHVAESDDGGGWTRMLCGARFTTSTLAVALPGYHAGPCAGCEARLL